MINAANILPCTSTLYSNLDNEGPAVAKARAVRLPHPQRISGPISDQAKGLAKEAAGVASGRLML